MLTETVLTEQVEVLGQHQEPIVHLEVIRLITGLPQGRAVIELEHPQEQRHQERLRIVIPGADSVVAEVTVLGEVVALEVVEITEVHEAAAQEAVEACEVPAVVHEAAEACEVPAVVHVAVEV